MGKNEAGIKLIALTDLLSDIAGRDILSGSMYHNRDAVARSAVAAKIFSRLRGQLKSAKAAMKANDGSGRLSG